jgi:hypothetical protein
MYAHRINGREALACDKALCHGQQEIAGQSLPVEGARIFDGRFESSSLGCPKRLQRRLHLAARRAQVISAGAGPVELPRELGHSFVAAKTNRLDDLSSRLQLVCSRPLCRAGAARARRAHGRLSEAR